eukprot:3931316-Prymnesium_polylepis.1
MEGGSWASNCTRLPDPHKVRRERLEPPKETHAAIWQRDILVSEPHAPRREALRHRAICQASLTELPQRGGSREVFKRGTRHAVQHRAAMARRHELLAAGRAEERVQGISLQPVPRMGCVQPPVDVRSEPVSMSAVRWKEHELPLPVERDRQRSHCLVDVVADARRVEVRKVLGRGLVAQCRLPG